MAPKKATSEKKKIFYENVYGNGVGIELEFTLDGIESVVDVVPLKMDLLAHPSMVHTQLLKGTCFLSKVHAVQQGSCQSTKIPIFL